MITTATILIIWQTVAAYSAGYTKSGWVYMGEYTSVQTCKEAARQLAVDHFRCIPK